jgi:hypothetical protein
MEAFHLTIIDEIEMTLSLMTRPVKFLAGLVVVSSLICFSADAEEYLFDFESDPAEDLFHTQTTQPEFLWGRADSNPWGAKGNDSDGFLSLSEAIANTSSVVVFHDLLDGAIAKRFTFSMDVRTGNGKTELPGNGFSINFARSNDPMLENLETGSLNTDKAAIGGLLETGTRTGLSVSFDTWKGNTLPDSQDIVGLIIRVDNRTVASIPMPVLHGDISNTTSLQTGPLGGGADNPELMRGDPNVLGWSPLVIEMSDTGFLNINYKEEQIVQNLDTGFFPSLGHFVIMGRTSDVNEIQHIDNVRIDVEPADQWLFAGLIPNAMGFTFRFRNVGESQIDPETVRIAIDGNNISDLLNLVTDGDFLIVTWTNVEAFESESEHFLEVSASGFDSHFAELKTTFTAPKYATIPLSLALKEVDVSNDGFLLFIKQSEGDLENTTEARLGHLEDSSLNIADQIGSRSDTWSVKLVNFDQDGDAMGLFQELGNGSPHDVGDDFIPGIPGLTDSTENVSGFIQTVVRILEPGFYTFGFSSGAGFRATAGNSPDERILLGEFNGVRKDSATEYQVFFESSGDYALQTLWYSGDGNANFEWFTTTPSSVLLNDTAHGGIQTFATLPGTLTRVSDVSPAIDATQVAANQNVSVTIEEVEATVDPESVSLELSDGTKGDVSKAGKITTITVDREGALWKPGQVVSAELRYIAGNQEQFFTWSFTVEDYPTLTKSKTDLGTGENPGFQFRIFQSLPDRGNNVIEAEQHLDGTWRPGIENTANPAGGTISEDPARPGVIFEIEEVINFDQEALPQGNFFDSGDGSSTDRADQFISGIPGEDGRNDSMTAEILTFIEFPAAGYYRMIFNSADGFRVTEEHGAGSEAGIELGVFNGGRDAVDTLFGFKVIEPGIYPIRAIWFAGVGDASLEWATTAQNERWLINDSDGNALKSFSTRSGIPVDVDPDKISGFISSLIIEKGNVVIEYTGTLKSSENVTGPYTVVNGATSPYSIEPSKAVEFYIAE